MEWYAGILAGVGGGALNAVSGYLRHMRDGEEFDFEKASKTALIGGICGFLLSFDPNLGMLDTAAGSAIATDVFENVKKGWNYRP